MKRGERMQWVAVSQRVQVESGGIEEVGLGIAGEVGGREWAVSRVMKLAGDSGGRLLVRVEPSAGSEEFVGLSTTGRVMVRKKTEGAERTARVFSMKDLSFQLLRVGKRTE